MTRNRRQAAAADGEVDVPPESTVEWMFQVDRDPAPDPLEGRPSTREAGQQREEAGVAARHEARAEAGQARIAGGVDVHHHVVPEFYRDALRGTGLSQSIKGVDFPEWSLESSLAMMDRQGIQAVIASVSVPGVSLDPSVAPGLAREVNEFLADLARLHPGRFGGFAAVPLPDLDAAQAALGYALDDLGLDGVGLFSNYGGRYLGDPAFEPLWQELDRRRAVVFIHPTVPPGTGQPHFGLPASLCEFPFDTSRMVAQLLYNGTLERHPGVRVILPHAGGAVPYLAQRMALASTIDPSLATRTPADPVGLLRGLYYDVAMSGSSYTLPSLRALASPSHILLGTDFPFMPETAIAENGDQILSAGLDGSALDQMLWQNAGELFPRLHRPSRSLVTRA